jgi:AraC family transcriptional regulator, transcriptional activator of pobA
VATVKPRLVDITLEEHFANDLHCHLHLFSMHVRRVTGDWFFPSHEHFQYEINYVLEGRQEFTVGGKTYLQEPGSLMLIHPGEVHFNRSADGKPFTYFCLHFQMDDRQLVPVLNSTRQRYFASDSAFARRCLPQLLSLIEHARKPLEEQQIGRWLMLSELFQLFGSMVKELPGQVHTVTEPLLNDQLAQHISRRIESLINHSHMHGTTLEERTGIEDIARELGISLSYCNRVFRKTYQMSPRQYLSALMLQKAKHLLGQKDLSINHVAELLGYRELSHFSRQFKRWTGMPPAAYKQLLLGTTE